MYKVRIPKKHGYRLIYKPNEREKRLMRSVLPSLHAAQCEHCPPLVVHGFWKGRSPATNAWWHRQYAYTLSFDLKDFFDHVTPAHMPAGVILRVGWVNRPDGNEEIVGFNKAMELVSMPAAEAKAAQWPVHEVDLFPDGAARQGLPTSPLLANIGAARMDRELLALRDECGWFQYTRYADDLTFSTNRAVTVTELWRRVPAAVEAHGFVLNGRKTRLQEASRGRRLVTGVAVDAGGLWPTRRLKRRLRAAVHQGRASEAQGLAEWAAMKLPADFESKLKAHARTYDARPTPRIC